MTKSHLSEVMGLLVEQVDVPHGGPLVERDRFRRRHRSFAVELVRVLGNDVGEVRAAQL
jgi:hypothetical protein